MDTIKLWARNGDAVRQAIELGDSIVVFWPRSSVLHLARTGCCLANR
jgi:hypothetical protein